MRQFQFLPIPIFPIPRNC